MKVWGVYEMDDDDDDVDDLWGPPLVVKDDTFWKLPLRGCEFWFDFRTDVLEESFQIERYCELVWEILNEKKKIDEADKDVASSIGGSSDSVQDKTLLSATLPDAETSSAKSSLDEEDENTSSISDSQTVETKDSTNHTEEARLKTHDETEANDAITVEVAEDVDTSLSPVLESKIVEAEEHSCSSLVTHQVLDPIKQATENKSPSAISQENDESSTLKPLVVTREKANATHEDGEVFKDQQQKPRDSSLQDIQTATEPFTTESLLEMCDDDDDDDEKSKRSIPEAVKTVVKEEPIINMFTEAESKALLNPPGSVLIKKRKKTSNSSINTNLIRNTKQKVEATTPTESKPKIIKGPSVPPLLSSSTLDLIDRIRQRGENGKTMGEQPVILISELNDKTGKELRSIAKELKVTHYYKMKKEDLLQQSIMQLKLKLQLTDRNEQRIESLTDISLV